MQEADIALSGLGITDARLQVVDFTLSYHIETSAVAIKLKSNKMLYFVQPVSLWMSVLYFSLPLSCAIVTWVMELLHRQATESVSFWKQARNNLNLLISIYDCFLQNIFQQGETPFIKTS